MNTKNLDAIKRMVVRLQSIKETESLDDESAFWLDCALVYLWGLVDVYDKREKRNDSVR